MTNDIIITSVERTIEWHAENLFGHLGNEVTTQAVDYMYEHLEYIFECDFLPQCVRQGGNWAKMVMSGIQYWMPEIYSVMPDRSYSIVNLVNIVYNQLLIASLPELVVRICFEVLGMEMTDVAWMLGSHVYEWLMADDHYSPVSC